MNNNTVNSGKVNGRKTFENRHKLNEDKTKELNIKLSGLLCLDQLLIFLLENVSPNPMVVTISVVTDEVIGSAQHQLSLIHI